MGEIIAGRARISTVGKGGARKVDATLTKSVGRWLSTFRPTYDPKQPLLLRQLRQLHSYYLQSAYFDKLNTGGQQLNKSGVSMKNQLLDLYLCRVGTRWYGISGLYDGPRDGR